MRRCPTSSSVILLLLLTSIGFAQQAAVISVPNLIRYAGTMKDAQGAPVVSSTVGVTFAIYQQQEGSAPVWMETQNVTTDTAGNYSVLLGSTTAAGMPGDLFSQQEQRWLAVQVEGRAEEVRVLLVSVPYAFKAHEAETLGGRSASEFVLSKSAKPAASGEGSTSSAPTSLTASSTAKTSDTKKLVTPSGPTNFAGSTPDQIVGVTQSSTGAGVSATASTNAILGTATGAGYGVHGIANGSGGYGILAESKSSSGTGIGIKSSSSGTSGTGLRALATATSGTTTGVSAYVASAAGTAGVFNNAAGGKIFSGQNNGVEKFSVDGSGSVVSVNAVTGKILNSTTVFQIGGQGVLGIGMPIDMNLFAGQNAGAANVSGSGQDNTFLGSNAGQHNTVGYSNSFVGANAGLSNTGGLYNTFVGASAGYYQTGGTSNTFLGFSSGHYTTNGEFNTFVGDRAGLDNTTGGNNTAIGYQSGFDMSTSSNNTFLGYESGYNNGADHNVFVGSQTGFANTTGTPNVFVGASAGQGNTSGNNNTFLGDHAGSQNTTGSGNTFVGTSAGTHNSDGSGDVYIGNQGPNPGESNTIRIGDMQTAAYVAGIYGATSTSGAVVYVNSSGRLGTMLSSQRFKEQVQDMGDSTNALMKLRPVTFLYKPEYSDGPRTLQYGLIAEEVARVYPELVAYDKDGQALTVRYQYLDTMLLNEVQKEYRRAESEAGVIATQQQEIKAQADKIGELEQRLLRLESMMAVRTAETRSEHASAPGETE